MDTKKIKGIFDYIEIRKNYSKPVIINFTIPQTDIKHRNLQQALSAKIFNSSSNSTTEPNSQSSFPIKILSDKHDNNNKQIGLIDNIKDHLEDIIKEIHGSYLTKDSIVKILNDKFPSLSKSSLANFIKNKTLKSKNKVSIFLLFKM